MKKLFLLLQILLLVGCSYKAKPVIPSYFPSTDNVINGHAKVNFIGNVEQLDKKVDNKSAMICKAHDYSISMKKEYIDSVNKLIQSKFINSDNGELYEINIKIVNFSTSFDDEDEGARMAFGMLAGAPKIMAEAILDLEITVIKENITIIKDTIRAEDSDYYGYWACGDPPLAIKKIAERTAKKSLELIDRIVLAPLSMSKEKNTPISTETSIEFKLKELKKLLENNLITEDEYNRKRNEIIENY